MADENKVRIKDQPLDTALSPGDLIIVDSEETGVGTRRFDLGQKLVDIDDSLLQVYVDGTTLVINGGIPNGEDVSY